MSVKIDNKKMNNTSWKGILVAAIIIVVCIGAIVLLKEDTVSDRENDITTDAMDIDGNISDDIINTESINDAINNENMAGANEQTNVVETEISVENEELQDNQVKEKADASYEHWLAAAMITAVSMQYSDFEIQGIYYSEENSLINKENSSGVYVVLSVDTNQLIIHSVPLKEERQELGTIDLYTRDLGFSTFDNCLMDVTELENYKKIEVEELSELISQSLLVSLYER